MSKRLSIVIIVSVVILIISFPIIYGFTVLKWTNKQVRSELDNQYIEGNYAGWRIISLESNTTFKIPEEWILKQDGNRIMFLDGENVMVKGAKVLLGDPSNPEEYEQYIKESLAEEALFFSFDVCERDVEELTVANLGTGAQYYAVTCKGTEGEEETHYMLFLVHDNEYAYIFDFGLTEETKQTKYDYMTAIAYSYDTK